ncbi:hypothetical protein KDW_10840 [Dictyobacter vulcani]|uniref:Uncharacterized protein n=1 Tax=Dictyobacter vulcani TaxID=2607529 RepID=A0A5J4KJ02_9CHLR|nr:hypothetical protein KDW_10840 [Dictyobacter vulcani]
MHLKTGSLDRLSATSTEKMLWMPGGTQSPEVISPDHLPTALADWLHYTHNCLTLPTYV